MLWDTDWDTEWDTEWDTYRNTDWDTDWDTYRNTKIEVVASKCNPEVESFRVARTNARVISSQREKADQLFRYPIGAGH